MKTRSYIHVMTLVITLALPTPTNLLAQGSLTPPGPPSPMMKTLDQIDAKLDSRTPISSAPFTITNSGSFYLTANLAVSSGNAITIATNGVTLNLNGYTIRSTAASANGYAIQLNAGVRNITIINGFIESGVTNNGSGTYGGPGFVNGIYYSGASPVNARVAGVSVTGCLTRGIFLDTGNSTIVESCTVQTAGGNGIYAAVVRGCVALDCKLTAINGDQVSDSRGESTTTGNGVSGLTLLNCSGASGSGNGISATWTGLNCFGTSTSGIGLVGWNVSFCTGSRSGGTAIQATMANGCIALAGTNNVTYKYNMP